MLVSVIIPAFNEEQTIGQVIEAVQSVPIKKQIIVVNDGSTDGTNKILEALRTVHELTVVHCQENSGKGFAIRSGLPYVKERQSLFRMQIWSWSRLICLSS